MSVLEATRSLKYAIITSTPDPIVTVCSYKDLTTLLLLQSNYKVLEVGSGMGTCAAFMADVSW